MKFYETTFEEYLHANEELNIHPELNKVLRLYQMTYINLKIRLSMVLRNW